MLAIFFTITGRWAPKRKGDQAARNQSNWSGFIEKMSEKEPDPNFHATLVSSLSDNTPNLADGVHLMPRLIMPLIDTVQKGGGAEKA